LVPNSTRSDENLRHEFEQGVEAQTDQLGSAEWSWLARLLIARVVLFDDVFQVGTGSTSVPTPQLKFRDHFLV
jgi:hypothetical protein